MKVIVVALALTVSAAFAGAVAYIASSFQAVAAYEPLATTSVWQIRGEFPNDSTAAEGVEADLDGNASALVASTVSDKLTCKESPCTSVSAIPSPLRLPVGC